MVDGIADMLVLATHVPAGGGSGGGAHAADAVLKVGGEAVATLSPMVALIPFLPLVGCVLAGLCAAFKVRSKLPAWISVGCIGAAFGLTLSMFLQMRSVEGAAVVHAWEWLRLSWGSGPGQTLIADFSFYVDSLTCLWMLFVTGLATLIALYASEYMAGDVGPGYCRFFAAFCLFVFSMACLVMADNLVLLYLGWEGVGLCSYLLIGYFYTRPSAVAAAKKAFIMNRIGDLGLALGIFLTFVQFGTVEYSELLPAVEHYAELALAGHMDQVPYVVQLIPVLFTVGAFGKSAQLPLYVWLPDAMEGPTPVSALIHAATMVTAGVYLVARTLPVYACSEWALPIVAWVGALTALLAATIGMAQFDIKRIMAYSTVSQLGYMFAALGVGGSVGSASHVFTHAFFKALLFLSCGAVMHGFAGQLDLRKLSGVSRMPGWRVVSIAMLVGCLNLAGFPVITAGFWSKDMILADAFSNPAFGLVGWVLLVTAGLTAYYTFRVFFRVFLGPAQAEPGDEHHGGGDGHGDAHGTSGAHGHDHAHSDSAQPGHDSHGAPASGTGHSHGGAHAGGSHGHGEFHPHAPGWAINLVLGVLAAACFAVIPLFFLGEHHGWVGDMVHHSSAAPLAAHGGEHAGAEHTAHGTFLGMDPHKVMYYVSAVVGLGGIGAAWWLHLAGRTSAAKSKADEILPAVGPVAGWAQHKWYVDELYNAVVRVPVLVLSHVLHLVDKLVVDGLVNTAGRLPRWTGQGVRPVQCGSMHSYAAMTAAGLGLLVVVALVVML